MEWAIGIDVRSVTSGSTNITICMIGLLYAYRSFEDELELQLAWQVLIRLI
jgi:hypothetical protein